MHVRVYIHPTCYSSYRLVLGLAERGLLGRVELVDASRSSVLRLLERGVVSVPWVEVDGEPVATDPVSVEELEAIIRGGRLSVDEPEEAVIEAVLHSAFLTAAALLNRSLGFVDEGFVAAATRARLSGVDAGAVAARVRGMEVDERLLDMLVRAATVSFIRELVWGGVRDASTVKSLDPAVAAAWLAAKASVGRLGLPARPWKTIREIGERMATFASRAPGLVRKAIREVEELESNHRYWEILEEHAATL